MAETVDKRRIIRVIIAIVLIVLSVFCAWRLNRYLERRTYKLTYQTLIRRYSKEFELDPYLVASIIHVESGNRSSVVSGAGAIGLMQIMPDTGAWIAGKLQVSDYTEKHLKDPETNIRFGCWYLRFLLDRFEITDTAVAAYNAGHNLVRKWLDDAQYSDNGDELTDIPYPDTEYYVEKVQRAYEKYRKLYHDAF